MCADLNLQLLGKVPLDPRIARSCDEGKSFLNEVPDSPAAKAYGSIVQSECRWSIYFDIVGIVAVRLRKLNPHRDIFWFPEKTVIIFDD